MKIATHYTDIIISKIIITNCRNLKIRTHRKCVATQPLAALRQAMACCSGVIQIRIFFSRLVLWTPMAMVCGLVGMLLSPPRSLAWTGHFFVHPALYNLLLGRWYIHIFMMRRICCWSRCRKVDKKKQVVFETFPTTMELIIARADDGFGWSIRGFPPPTTTAPESRSRPGGLLPAAATNPVQRCADIASGGCWCRWWWQAKWFDELMKVFFILFYQVTAKSV